MIAVILLVLGICLGSFTNALVWRIRQQSKPGGKKGQYSITKGHSMCPKCKHRLQAGDLVPVLSWVELRGRCRYCQAKISWLYPFVELLVPALFLVSYWHWPYGFSGPAILAFGVWLAIVILLVALSAYDFKWMTLPDRLVYPLIAFSVLLSGLLVIDGGDLKQAFSPALGAIFLSGLFWVLFQVSGGKWLGGGDVKIAVALGLIAGGLNESILLLFIASLLGSLVSIPLLIKGKNASHKVPFGPFLISASFMVFLWGSAMIDWYTRLIGV